MKRFKNILLYAGGEIAPAPAIERAKTLALANRARLALVDVLAEESTGRWITLPGKAALDQELLASRREELESLAAPLREEGLEVETRILVGRVFVELIREVQRHGHDLVMKTAQGLGGGLGGLLGSTALHLLRKCPCPVWVVKPGDSTHGSVLAAIEPDLENPSEDGLTRTLLELASSLARARGAALEVVHAWWLSSESMLRSRRMNLPSETVDQIVEETREIHARAVEQALAPIDLSGIAYRVHVEQGVPFQVISRYSKRADVAVMGTLSRAGIAGVLIGNTAERILHQVDCSVLAVKPHGFESPVQVPADPDRQGA